MKKTYITVILFVLVISATVFIFCNSSKNIEATYHDSDSVVEMIKPIIDETSFKKEYTIDFWVRKAAHGIEFCFLGICVAALLVHIKNRYQKSFLGFGFFYLLLVAVIDEFIQSFNERTSCVEDIVIDFCGAVVGLILVALLIVLYKFIKQKKSNKSGGKNYEKN
ncbi:MAG: VanZ family protein [Clostridia bacterium]|nr:VanZ family protein [Clostridia bacterium]